MTTAAWLLLVTTWGVGVVSPGPDFVAVLRTAARSGRRTGIACAAGVALGMSAWIVLAMAGVSTVLLAHETLFVATKVVGGLVLLGYGVLILRGVLARRGGDATVGDDPAGAGGRVSSTRAFRLGLMTNLSNPKALVFFGALFASIIPADVTVLDQLATLGVMIAMGLGWFVLVACAAGSRPVVSAYERAERPIDAVLGALFGALGIGVVAAALR